MKEEKEPFNAVTKEAKRKGVIGNIAKVMAAAQQAGVPIIFGNHIHWKGSADGVLTITDWMLQGPHRPPREPYMEGTPGVEIVDELKPAPEDRVIWKPRSNSFYSSTLELMLRS